MSIEYNLKERRTPAKKNIFKISLSILLAVALLCCSAFAETFTFGSVSNAVEVQGDGITITDTDTKLTTQEAADVIGNGATPSQCAIVLNGKDITAPTTPVTLSFTANGTVSPQKLFVCHYIDGAWKVEGSGNGPTVTITVNQLSPFAVVVWTPSEEGPVETSPKTGETVLPYAAIGAAMVAAAAAVILRRKED